MKTKYILVEWPESQKWIGHSDCYIVADKPRNEFFTPICFVPENIYNLSKKN